MSIVFLIYDRHLLPSPNWYILWYLERLDQPELFVSIIKSFELPEGVTSKDWARPGVDPMKKLDLCKSLSQCKRL